MALDKMNSNLEELSEEQISEVVGGVGRGPKQQTRGPKDMDRSNVRGPKDLNRSNERGPKDINRLNKRGPKDLNRINKLDEFRM